MFAPVALLVLAPIFQILKGEASIVPPEPLPLGGYTERLGKALIPGGDTLKARSLVFIQGPMRIAFVEVEMLTVPQSLAEAVAKRLTRRERLFLSATHTHCAPDSQMLNDRMTFALPGIAGFRQRWLDWYADRIAQAVNLAKPYCSPERIWVEERRVDANRPRRKLAEPDTLSASVVGFANQGYPLFFHYAAHPVNYDASELRLRSDWPGLVADRGLTLLGAIGDVSPKSEGATGDERLADFRKRLLKPVPYFETTIAEGKQQQFRWVSEPISLNPVEPHPEFATSNRIPTSLATTIITKFAPTNVNVSAVRIGKLAIIGVPGEPTAELGRKIKAAGMRIGFSVVLVVSHTNGWMGYILSASDYERGGYEATLSFYGPEEGDEVVQAAERALTKLAKIKDGTR